MMVAYEPRSRIDNRKCEARAARRVAWLVIVVACILIPHAKAEDAHDWSCFRGGPAMTGVAPAPFPARPELLWTHEAGSGIESTAAIVGSKVYVGTSGGKLLALGLEDGKRLWEFDAAGAVSGAPCVMGDVVYVGDEAGTFHAIDAATGQLRWQFETGGKIISSATPAPDAVLFGSYDNTLYCLDGATGEVKWKFEADAQVHCSPCVAAGLVMIAGCDCKIRIIELGTGEEKAAAEAEANFAACPAYAGGYVYTGALNGEYLSMKCEDGSVAWRIGDEKLGPCFAGAAVCGERVVFASRDRKVFCVDRAAGRLQWTFGTRGKVDSSPVIAARPRAADQPGPLEKTVFVGCADGIIYGLNLSDGRKIWQFRAGAEVNASPAIGRGRMVIGTGDGAVYCFGEDPGEN